MLGRNVVVVLLHIKHNLGVLRLTVERHVPGGRAPVTDKLPYTEHGTDDEHHEDDAECAREEREGNGAGGGRHLHRAAREMVHDAHGHPRGRLGDDDAHVRGALAREAPREHVQVRLSGGRQLVADAAVDGKRAGAVGRRSELGVVICDLLRADLRELAHGLAWDRRGEHLDKGNPGSGVVWGEIAVVEAKKCGG